MASISLCMIVKNEENTLARCLKSTGNIFDEIIIVDTGSDDKTKEISKEFTDKIYDFVWCDDFSKARNFSFSKATMEYIMWLDADDIILEDDFKKLTILKDSFDNINKNIDVVMLKYNLDLDSQGVPALSYYRERIFKRIQNPKWVSPIHEVIVPFGNIIKENIAITHSKLSPSDPGRNLRIFEKMIKDNVVFDARQTFYYARELYYTKKYNRAINIFNKFLKMKDAWVENKISALIDLHYIYISKENTSKALYSLFKTFELKAPKAEVCCHIGNIFISRREYHLAIYWFTQALNGSYDISSGAFVSPDYYYFIPYIQLCVCYYNMGDIDKAIFYNNLAGKEKPESDSYMKNVKFFEEYFKA